MNSDGLRNRIREIADQVMKADPDGSSALGEMAGLFDQLDRGLSSGGRLPNPWRRRGRKSGERED